LIGCGLEIIEAGMRMGRKKEPETGAASYGFLQKSIKAEIFVVNPIQHRIYSGRICRMPGGRRCQRGFGNASGIA